MQATCICYNGSLLDQLCCTTFNLIQLWSNKYVCLSHQGGRHRAGIFSRLLAAVHGRDRRRLHDDAERAA